MRLYVTPTGKWAGTQADAKELAKEEGTGWEQRDVPTDKDGLLSFLNSYRVDAMHGEAKAMIVASAEAPNHKPAFTQEQVDAMFKAPVPASKAISADVICEAISELDGVPLGHVALEVAARFKALASRETENASIRERF